MEAKQNDWKILRLFTVSVVAAIVSSALSYTTVVQAETILEPTIEDRLATVREYLKNRCEKSTDPSYAISSIQDNAEAYRNDQQLSQWYNSPNWNNWSKWGNWGDWGNWYNY